MDSEVKECYIDFLRDGVELKRTQYMVFLVYPGNREWRLCSWEIGCKYCCVRPLNEQDE